MLAEEDVPTELRTLLLGVQHDLFELGGELSLPGQPRIAAADVARLEDELDRLNATLPPLKEFVLPGGSRAAAACHLARTIVRRAERRTWTLAQASAVNEHALRYLNRLSDLLFVVARLLARRNGGVEVLWQRDRG